MSDSAKQVPPLADVSTVAIDDEELEQVAGGSFDAINALEKLVDDIKTVLGINPPPKD